MRSKSFVIAVACGAMGIILGCDGSLSEDPQLLFSPETGFSVLPGNGNGNGNGGGPCTPPEPVALGAVEGVTDTITFEGLDAGTIVSSIFGEGGTGPVLVKGTNPAFGSGVNAAVVFDSGSPTGGDFDLGSPNEGFSGPGIGEGGEPGMPFENDTALGKLLIVDEHLVVGPDGLVIEPDDATRIGSAIEFDFTALGTVTVSMITIVDVEAIEEAATVEFFDGSGNTLAFFTLPQTGDNGVAFVDFGDVSGVETMLVLLNGSGAIDNIVYTTDGDPGLECRVTGGGVDTFDQWDGSLAEGNSGQGNNNNRYQFGGQAGAPTASQPQPSGEWTHHQQRGPDGRFTFHAGTASAPPETEIDLIVCSDPGYCIQARPAPAKQIDFQGVGTFKNITDPSPALEGVVPGETIHWFTVHIEDLGEPGNNGQQGAPACFCPPGGSAGFLANCDCPDFYHITIYKEFDPAGPANTTDLIYEVFGYIKGGNLQIHPPIQ